MLAIKTEHEQWVETSLRSGELESDVEEAIYRIHRFLERQRISSWLLNMDFGNSRFLHALAKAPGAFGFARNADKQFYDSFLAMLDERESEFGAVGAPFTFELVNSWIAFPDEYESYSLWGLT